MDNRFNECKKGQRNYLVVFGCVLLFLCAVISAFGETVDLLEMPTEKVDWAPSSILMDAVRVGDRIALVGEAGHILYSDNQGKDWTQADVPVSVTLTAVYFPTADQGWAVGHEGVVLHTGNGGKTWKKQLDGVEINKLVYRQLKQMVKAKNDLLKKAGLSKKERKALKSEAEELGFLLNDAEFYIEQGPCQPLMDVWFKNVKEGLVIGANGVIFSTKDGGNTWRPMLDRIENFGRHLYAVIRSGKDLFIAGEAGNLFRSEDFGRHWRRLESPYIGSFFGIIGEPSGGFVAAFGMRGNIYYSKDRGETWKRADNNRDVSLFGGALLSDGSFCVVGADGVILRSADRGKTLTPLSNQYFGQGMAIAELKKEVLAVVGTNGVSQIEINNPGGKK